MNILLFDMDHVLLEPYGYGRALQETIAMIGRALGYQDARLSDEDWEYFEAAGVTSEWEISAMCTALLLGRAWQVAPSLRLPDRPPLADAAPHNLPPPDFCQLAQALDRDRRPGESSLFMTERILIQDRDSRKPEQIETLSAILRNAREPRSLTFLLFQELALGSEAFANAYHLPPALETQPYLALYDQPALSPASLDRLFTWLAVTGHSAAIFTNRPTRSPDGRSGTPEAELGAQVAGVEALPIIGLGGLAWLAQSRGLPEEAYLKPSPVHVLAALRVALGDPLEAALVAAADLVEDGVSQGWELLKGASVTAFEDAAKGLASALEAVEILRRQGIAIQLSLVGITQSPPKRNALKKLGATIYPTLEAALAEVV